MLKEWFRCLGKPYDETTDTGIISTPLYQAKHSLTVSGKLGFKEGMVIASINVNSLPLRLYEIDFLLKEKVIHFPCIK